jgi:hypothetical protein
MSFIRGTSALLSRGFLLLGFGLMLAGCAELMSDRSDDGGSASAPAPSDGKPGKAGAYAITFGVKNNAGRLGALQFTVRPRDAGTWQGEGANVACRSLTGQAMHACNEKSQAVLSCGFVDTKGIKTPGDLVTCTFRSTKGISKDDFSIKVIDATDVAIKRVNADVEVTRVVAK